MPEIKRTSNTIIPESIVIIEPKVVIRYLTLALEVISIYPNQTI